MNKKGKTAVKASLKSATGFKFASSLLNLSNPLTIKQKLRSDVTRDGDVNLAYLTKASYGDKNAIGSIEKAGYKRDVQLSNHNQSVFFNERTGDLKFVVAGTHNINPLSAEFSLSDLITDAKLAVGGLKTTRRYKEAKDIFGKAKAKYNKEGKDIAVIGHSLGGSIASRIAAEEGARATTYNKGVGIGGILGFENNAAGEKAYRTRGDAVSFLGIGKKGTKAIGRGITLNPLEAHSSENLSEANIFV